MSSPLYGDGDTGDPSRERTNKQPNRQICRQEFSGHCRLGQHDAVAGAGDKWFGDGEPARDTAYRRVRSHRWRLNAHTGKRPRFMVGPRCERNRQLCHVAVHAADACRAGGVLPHRYRVILLTLPRSHFTQLTALHRTSSDQTALLGKYSFLRQGDGGNISTTGGWLRLFGRSFVLGGQGQGPSGTQDGTAAAAAAAAVAVIAAAKRGDFSAAARLASAAAAAATTTPSGWTGKITATAPPVTLILTNTVNGKRLPPLPAVNASEVDAFFLFPPALVPPGTYRITVSNGYAASTLDSFVSPAQPHVDSITVVAAADVAFKATRFTVADYGCGGGVNTTGYPINCSRAVLAAIAAAGANGGGTVYFGPGRWYDVVNAHVPHTHAHTRTPKDTPPHTPTLPHIHIHTYTHTHIHTYTHTQVRPKTLPNTHVHAHTHTHTRAHAHIRAHTHTHTHTHKKQTSVRSTSCLLLPLLCTVPAQSEFAVLLSQPGHIPADIAAARSAVASIA